jgi:hypothetical protein
MLLSVIIDDKLKGRLKERNLKVWRWWYYPDNGGCKHLWNISLPLWDYTAQYPRMLSDSYLLPWECEISLRFKNFYVCIWYHDVIWAEDVNELERRLNSVGKSKQHVGKLKWMQTEHILHLYLSQLLYAWHHPDNGGTGQYLPDYTAGARRPCNGCKRRLHLQIK